MILFEVVYIKAEYEPWWMFEGWEETALSRTTFETKEEAEAYMSKMVEELRASYTNEESRSDCFYAFWNESEKVFCEACDDDLQVYHGLLLLRNGVPAILANK